MPRPLFLRNGSWDLLKDWPKSSILDQCKGEPFFLELDDSSWINTARKTLESSSWTGFLSFPLVTPVCPEVSPSSRDGQERFSQVKCDSMTWRIILDARHFCPEEINVKLNEGYLEITGMSFSRNQNSLDLLININANTYSIQLTGFLFFIQR